MKQLCSNKDLLKKNRKGGGSLLKWLPRMLTGNSGREEVREDLKDSLKALFFSIRLVLSLIHI